jgi:hypothetical protein
MAGLRATLDIPSNSITAATPTCFAFVTAPTNQRVKILAYGFYFDGTLNSAQPVEIKLARPTAGTLTAGGTAIKEEPGFAETVQSTVGLAASVQPTLTGTNWVASINAPAGVDVRGYVMFEE